MMRRSTKWIILVVFFLLLVSLGIFVYFTAFQKSGYQVEAIGDNNYTVKEFKQSELKFYPTGVFHLTIIHNGTDTFFIGTGTYEKDGANYKLTFTHAEGYDRTINAVRRLDLETQFPANTVLTKEPRGLKFVDHLSQVYYFG